ncbi:NAD(P)-dependent dehydrogenase (short-subunit alcohol dehydrogenase family) [Rathayibacter sp. PhB93]|nr:coniferyl-alcohol dehydrogenase [Rathayibacter sp. PhB1]ROQ04632.1 NAD(P)-dependent dehydrogenase (short-subunit alcohol dehydrogenase family) [Rathayibacter sp. PhB93]TDQ13470.1 NAD(P)-dependent dehydrogenase (short-subunit alcohol dehydrogenase family) [Rathayibacter sp. PhB1]
MYSEYAGKTVVVTGASSGIGEATAVALHDLGAHVIAASRREPAVETAGYVSLDLSDPASISAAAAAIDGDVYGLFNCAGAVPMLDPLDILKVNYLGTRLFTELLVDKMAPESAIANVSSDAGYGWRKKLDLLLEFVAIPSFDAAASWYSANEEAAGHAYTFGKEALNVWSMQQSQSLIKRGIRINTTSPGAVQTPMLEAIEEEYSTDSITPVTVPSGRRSSPAEQAGPLLFLNSSHASYVNGVDIVIDGGYWAGQTLTGVYWD